jgi:hypothetical protein
LLILTICIFGVSNFSNLYIWNASGVILLSNLYNWNASGVTKFSNLYNWNASVVTRFRKLYIRKTVALQEPGPPG